MPPESGVPDGSPSGSRSGREKEVEGREDDALMARVADGDAQAFAAVVSARLERVLATARRMLGNDADAEEVAQEAFLRLWRHAEQWQPGRARISTWLYRVTSNLAIDRLRVTRPTTMPELPETPVAAEQGRALDEAALTGHLDRALRTLPERQRLALVLFHYEEQSMAQVAELMGVSVEAVESLLARGRRALKGELKDTWQDLLPEERD